jgi:serine/threonine protein kinase
MTDPKIGEASGSGSITRNNESTTINARSLKDSDRLKTENNSNTLIGVEKQVNKSQTVQLLTTEVVSILDTVNQPSTNNLLKSTQTMDKLTESEKNSLILKIDEGSNSEKNDGQVQTPRKLTGNRQSVNQDPQEEFDQKFNEIKNNIEKLPFHEQLNALDQLIENSQGVSKVAAESFKETIEDRVEKYGNLKPDIEAMPLKKQITDLDYMIRNVNLEFGDKSAINEKIALQAIKEDIINEKLPKDIPLTNGNGEMRAFIKDFKEILQIEKVLGIAKPSRTDSVVKALEEYEKVLNKYPDDTKKQLEAMEKVQAKIEKFIETAGDSTKIGWVKALQSKIVPVLPELLVKSIQQNGISELSGRIDLYKNNKAMNDAIEESILKDELNRPQGSGGTNTWNVIKENPDKFFAVIKDMPSEQKYQVLNSALDKMHRHIDLKDKAIVDKYTDLVFDTCRGLDRHSPEFCKNFPSLLSCFHTQDPEMRNYILNKAFNEGMTNSTIFRNYIQMSQIEIQEGLEQVHGIRAIEEMKLSLETIMSNPDLKEFAALKQKVDAVLKRNPEKTMEEVYTEASHEHILMNEVFTWNTVMGFGNDHPDFKEFALMTTHLLYQAEKAGFSVDNPNFNDNVTDKIDKDVFLKIKEIRGLGTQDEKIEAAEKLLGEMGLPKDQLVSKQKIFLRDFILHEIGLKNLDDRNKFLDQLQTENPTGHLEKVVTEERRFDPHKEYKDQVAKVKENQGKMNKEITSFDPKTLKKTETEEKGIDVRGAYKKEKDQVIKAKQDQVNLNEEITSFDPKTLKKTETEEKGIDVRGAYKKEKDQVIKAKEDQINLNEKIKSFDPKTGLKHVETVEKKHDFQTEYKEQVQKNKELIKNKTDRQVEVTINPITTEEGQKVEIQKSLNDLVARHKKEDGTLDMEPLKKEAGEMVKKGGISSDLTWALLVNESPYEVIVDLLKKSELTMEEKDLKVAAVELLQEMMKNVPTIKNNKLEINGKDYDLGRELGKGGFGTAFSLDNEFVAKVQNDQTNNPIKAKKLKQEAIQELNAHKNSGNHPNVLKIVGVARTENGSLVPITEFASGGDLDGVMKKINESNVSDSEKIMVKQYLLRKIMEGMDHVQVEQGMIHFDLKGGNILFDKNEMEPKIGDFGMSEVTKTSNKRGGTPDFVSPELVNGRLLNNRTDTWALGVIMHEMMFEKLPITIPDLNNVQGLINKIGQFGENQNNRILKVKEVEQEHTELKIRRYNQNNPRQTIDDFNGNKEQFKKYEENRKEDLINLIAYKETVVTPQNALALIINQMMHPDPNQRPTLEAVKQLSFFTDPLGTDEQAKEVLKKILG